MLDECRKCTIEGLRNKSCHCYNTFGTKEQKCRHWHVSERYLQVVGFFVLEVVGAVVGSTVNTKEAQFRKIRNIHGDFIYPNCN